MFGIDWNMDGEIDVTDDFLTLAFLDEESEEAKENVDENQNEGE